MSQWPVTESARAQGLDRIPSGLEPVPPPVAVWRHAPASRSDIATSRVVTPSQDEYIFNILYNLYDNMSKSSGMLWGQRVHRFGEDRELSQGGFFT